MLTAMILVEVSWQVLTHHPSYFWSCEISGSYGSMYENESLLGYSCSLVEVG